MKIATIRLALKTLLEDDDSIEVAKVYDYPRDELEGYPAILVNSAGWNPEFSDTGRNMYVYHFELYLFQAIIVGTVNEEKARKRVDKVCDQIMTSLKDNLHLAGATLVKPIEGEASSIVERPIETIMVKMNIDFEFLLDR